MGAKTSGSPEKSGRRKFFFFGAMALASTLAPRKAIAQRLPPQRIGTRSPAIRKPVESDTKFPMVVPRLDTPAPSHWQSPLIRLVRRATMGLAKSDVAAVNQMGYQSWLQAQLNPSWINDDLVQTVVGSRYPLLAQEPEDLYNVSGGTVNSQLREGTIYRAAFSQRQLYERMVEFWSDHFNIAIDKVGYLKVIDDREVIRKHALGRFHDMVHASSKSPAMLAYLDQNLSRSGRANENYARELMELHTLGVDGGYTQQDVVDLARVLTGWTFQGRGRFVFNSNLHDWGEKTVLGMHIPSALPSVGVDAVREGEMVIDMLLDHPSTARFIATKMLKWLLTPEPTENQVQTIAGVYTATKGDIKLMVRAILNDAWLPAAPMKFKRPFHLLTSALRSLDPSVTSLSGTNGQLNAMGHVLFDWETPDGYPDAIEYWAGNIVTRWSFAQYISTRSDANISIDVTPYSGNAITVVDAINENLFGGELSPSTRTLLLGYLNGGSFNITRIRETLALAMSSSGFQWY